jgi:hypothetical protein
MLWSDVRLSDHWYHPFCVSVDLQMLNISLDIHCRTLRTCLGPIQDVFFRTKWLQNIFGYIQNIFIFSREYDTLYIRYGPRQVNTIWIWILYGKWLIVFIFGQHLRLILNFPGFWGYSKFLSLGWHSLLSETAYSATLAFLTLCIHVKRTRYMLMHSQTKACILGVSWDIFRKFILGFHCLPIFFSGRIPKWKKTA